MEEKPKKYNKDIKVRESRDMAWAHGRAPTSLGALRRMDEPEGWWNGKGTAQLRLGMRFYRVGWGQRETLSMTDEAHPSHEPVVGLQAKKKFLGV